MKLLITNFKIPVFLLRVAIAIPYLRAVFDRFGWLGEHGKPHVSWGDWKHFIDFSGQIMSFMPHVAVEPLAVIATVGELAFGAFLLLGLFTRFAAVGSAILSFLFAISAAISFGIHVPLSYSIFTLSTASLVLATIPNYYFSMDNLFRKNKKFFQ
jgi:putative oxidoreductase